MKMQVTATFVGGILKPDETLPLADQTRVNLTVEPIPARQEPAAAWPFLPEDDVEEGWDSTPEGIAAWLQWYNSIEPLKLSAAEEAEAEAWLKHCDEYAFGET